MAGESGKPRPDLIQELLENPEQFDFFQAVRLIERAAAERSRESVLNRIGGDKGPHNEAVRFRALASLTFPVGQISAITERKEHDGTAQLEMTVPFMGLTGPAGVLPDHYTSLVIERSHQRTKDHALREFLDLFNHRIISLFYRAWEKYRFPFAYERNQQEGDLASDLFTQCLYSLVGIQSQSLRDQHSFDDQAVLFFGGLFATRMRNAVSLQQMLCSYFELEVQVLQFQGQWLYLPEESQSSMPSVLWRSGRNLLLGETAIAGSRVWDVQSRIRVQLGPLSWRQFSELLPGQPRLKCIQEMVRLYIGVSLDFDVQLILRRDEVPLCRLTSDVNYSPQLGRNTWIGSAPEVHEPAGDAVFQL